ncbi:MAG: hypothetical protein KatS3mg013_0025 [Actinomycetota bacterium]|nr:MAG: hypothetical protein KatS3mg013_0025 [Actinomycetota bacterium]
MGRDPRRGPRHRDDPRAPPRGRPGPVGAGRRGRARGERSRRRGRDRRVGADRFRSSVGPHAPTAARRNDHRLRGHGEHDRAAVAPRRRRSARPTPGARDRALGDDGGRAPGGPRGAHGRRGTSGRPRRGGPRRGDRRRAARARARGELRRRRRRRPDRGRGRVDGRGRGREVDPHRRVPDRRRDPRPPARGVRRGDRGARRRRAEDRAGHRLPDRLGPPGGRDRTRARDRQHGRGRADRGRGPRGDRSPRCGRSSRRSARCWPRRLRSSPTTSWTSVCSSPAAGASCGASTCSSPRNARFRCTWPSGRSRRSCGARGRMLEHLEDYRATFQLVRARGRS